MKVTTQLQQLIDDGINPLFYYKGSAAVCLLVDGDKCLARGVSICSPKDTFNRKTGRNKALGRAIQALVNRKSSGEINPVRFDDIRANILGTIGSNYHEKSTYKPDLSVFEKNLIDRAKPK